MHNILNHNHTKKLLFGNLYLLFVLGQNKIMEKVDFDKHLGLKVVKRKKGYCRVRLDVKSKYLNKGGIVHGGVLASLCDVSLAGAVGTLMKKRQWCVTVQLQIEFMSPAYPDEPLFGYGRVVRIGKTLAFVEGGVETKDKTKISKAHGIWYIKEGPSKKIKIKKKIKQLD